MAMAFRASSSGARGLLAGDGGLTPNPGASLPHQRPKTDGSLGGKRQDLTPLPCLWTAFSDSRKSTAQTR